MTIQRLIKYWLCVSDYAGSAENESASATNEDNNN